MKNKIIKAIQGLFAVFIGLFISSTILEGNEKISLFSESKVTVSIDKIQSFKQISGGKGSPSYSAEIVFSYKNRKYQGRASINRWEYQQRDQLQKFPNQLVIYYSPITQQAYSQRSFRYSRYQSKNSFYFAILIIAGSLVIGLIIFLGKDRDDS